MSPLSPVDYQHPNRTAFRTLEKRISGIVTLADFNIMADRLTPLVNLA